MAPSIGVAVGALADAGEVVDPLPLLQSQGNNNDFTSERIRTQVRKDLQDCDQLVGQLDQSRESLKRLDDLHRLLVKWKVGANGKGPQQLQLPLAESKIRVLPKQRQSDPIVLQKREKKGARRRQTTSEAKDYVRDLNEALVCDACDMSGPPPTAAGHWVKQLQGLSDSDSDGDADDEQWFWVRCSDCVAYYHNTCVDPTLISTDSHNFICESCIENVGF